MKKIIARDRENKNKKEIPVVAYAPFPCVVLFFRTKDQAEGKYGTEENGYDCSFGFDTHISKLMGAEMSLLSGYKENPDINVCFKAKNKKNKEVEVRIYPRKKDMPDERDLKENDRLPAAYLTRYKIPMLHIPSDKKSIELTVVACMPDSNEVNKSYKEYKKQRKEESEEICFAIVQRNAQGNVFIEKDKKEYMRAVNCGLTLTTQSITHPINKKETLHQLVLSKNNDDPVCDNNLSVIAYYKNKSGGEANEKEMIIGQLNIEQTAIIEYANNIANNADSKYNYDLLVSYGADIKPSDEKIVLDINFVRVLFDKNEPLPADFPDTSDLLKRINTIYKQVGIEFRRRGTPDTRKKGYEDFVLPSSKIPYPIKTHTFHEEVEEAATQRITYSDLHFKNSFGNKDTIAYYENINDQEWIDIFRENYAYELFQRSHINQSSIYKQLKKEHFSSSKEESKASAATINEINKLFFDYFERRVINVFIMNQIDMKEARFSKQTIKGKEYSFLGGGEPGFAIIGGNMAFLFAGAMSNIDYSLAHELGHCLKLGHTFPFQGGNIQLWPHIPYNFTPSQDYRGVTYNNIMDYEDRNTLFRGDTFAMFQQKEMIKYLSDYEYFRDMLYSQQYIINKFNERMDNKDRKKYFVQLENLYNIVFPIHN